MIRLLNVMAAAALFAAAATVAAAQQTTPAPTSKSEMGAQEQGPSKRVPDNGGVGSRPIAPPDTAVTAPGKNPSNESAAKRKSDQDDPRQGGKKQ
jgi:hypothetical protein